VNKGTMQTVPLPLDIILIDPTRFDCYRRVEATGLKKTKEQKRYASTLAWRSSSITKEITSLI